MSLYQYTLQWRSLAFVSVLSVKMFCSFVGLIVSLIHFKHFRFQCLRCRNSRDGNTRGSFSRNKRVTHRYLLTVAGATKTKWKPKCSPLPKVRLCFVSYLGLQTPIVVVPGSFKLNTHLGLFPISLFSNMFFLIIDPEKPSRYWNTKFRSTFTCKCKKYWNFNLNELCRVNISLIQLSAPQLL